jgi:hypothetical protein
MFFIPVLRRMIKGIRFHVGFVMANFPELNLLSIKQLFNLLTGALHSQPENWVFVRTQRPMLLIANQISASEA